MAVAISDRRPVRAGWTLPVVVAGVVVAVGGLVVRRDVGPVRSVCQINAQIRSLMESVAKTPRSFASCSSLDLRYDLGTAAAVLGLLIVAVGFVCLMRRSRRAGLAGASWPIRRVMDASARWLEACLPGGHSGSRPRLRGGYLALLSVTVGVVVVVGAVSLWHSHERSERIHAYDTATAALAALELPSSVERTADVCGDPVCGRSSLSPPQVEPMLRRLLNGAPNPVSALLPCAGRCPVVIYGRFKGSLAVGVAFWHLLIVRHGEPPKGAIPVRPGTAVRPGHPYAYYLGSEINIGLVNPDEND
jgi:hypothetical protein